MKEVVVNPEKCVGCMQCMLACATAHSKTQQMFTAIQETPRPRPRVHVGAGRFNEGFPNRCRHCEPAPCQLACLTGAIARDQATATVLIDPERCINCASCAMACPYGVIRFHEDPFAPRGQPVAVKCDNCGSRVSRGLDPACVEVCKTGALVYEEMAEVMRQKTAQVARCMSTGAGEVSPPDGVTLIRAAKQAQLAVGTE